MDQPSFGKIKRLGDDEKQQSAETEAVNDYEPEKFVYEPDTKAKPAPTKLRLANKKEAPVLEDSACPSCSEEMPAGDIICMSCGYNIKSARAFDQAPTSSSSNANPYQPSKAPRRRSVEASVYGGIGRGMYWLYSLGWGVACWAMVMAFLGTQLTE